MEAQDFTTYTLDSLMGSLATYEINLEGLKVEEEEVKKKRDKGIALKTTTQEESNDESSEDDVALLARKFNKFLNFKRKSGKKFNKTAKDDSSKCNIICYNCKKPGRIMADCPNKVEEKKEKREIRFKKKAMVASWGSSDEDSSSDEE